MVPAPAQAIGRDRTGKRELSRGVWDRQASEAPGVYELALRGCAPTPPEETAQPERCRSAGVAEGGSGGSGAEPPSICFSRAAARGGRPDTSGRNSPTGAMPVRRRRGGRERGFGGRAPEHLFLESGRTGRAPRHLRKKQPNRSDAGPPASRRAGAGSGAEPPSICFSRAAARGGRPDTSGRNQPNRSDAGPPASRRAGAGSGANPRASASREREVRKGCVETNRGQRAKLAGTQLIQTTGRGASFSC